MTWHMRYRVCTGSDAVERELIATFRWHVVAPDAIEAELAAAGFAVSHGPHGVVRAQIADR